MTIYYEDLGSKHRWNIHLFIFRIMATSLGMTAASKMWLLEYFVSALYPCLSNCRLPRGLCIDPELRGFPED